MKISIYSTAFNVIDNDFDYEDAIRNFAFYADEVCLAINKSKDDSSNVIKKFVKDNNFNVKIIDTEFEYTDPFCYGKIVNSALQACTGDICILQDLDERFGGDKTYLIKLCEQLLSIDQAKAFFVPVINLYGDFDHYKDIAFKWYIHKSGLYRGAVNFGIKDNGRPDYNKTSTDELIDGDSNLVPTINIVNALQIQDPYEYIQKDYPFVYHLGYTDLNNRVKRNHFWKGFWEKATGGDQNTHSLNVNDLIGKEYPKHNLKLWSKLQ
jgi:hypothetical protein